MSQVVATGLWPADSGVGPSQEEDGPQGRGYSSDDPIPLFQTWFLEAINSGIEAPSAMTVATVAFPEASCD